MFERFTEGSRAVVVEAQEIAIELGSGHLAAGHLLYGCAEGREETAGRPLRDVGITGTTIRPFLSASSARSDGGPDGPAGDIDQDALRAIGIDYDGIRAAVAETFGEGALDAAPDRRVGAPSRTRVRFTTEAKSSLQQALRVAVLMTDKKILPGHLLLGILRVDDAVVNHRLEQAGTSAAALTANVFAALEAR